MEYVYVWEGGDSVFVFAWTEKHAWAYSQMHVCPWMCMPEVIIAAEQYQHKGQQGHKHPNSKVDSWHVFETSWESIWKMCGCACVYDEGVLCKKFAQCV